MNDYTNYVADVQGFQPIKHYAIDFEKVETVKDLALILEALGVTVTCFHHNFKKLEHLLKEVKHEP